MLGRTNSITGGNSTYQAKLILKAVVEGGTPEEESKALEQAKEELEKI